MSKSQWQKKVDENYFSRFLEYICDQCLLADQANLLDGIGEMSLGEGVLRYAIDRKRAFAAVEWHVLRESTLLCIEAFFVNTETKGARTGLRIQQSGENNPQHLADTPEYIKWDDYLTGVTISEATNPYFIHLVATIASEGKTGLLLREQNEQVEFLTSEIENLNFTLLEQNEKLREYQSKLKTKQLTSFVTFESALDSTIDDKPIADTTKLSELPIWAAENIDRIVILPRALNGAKKSTYENPELIIDALELLAGPYRLNRTGKTSKAEFDEAMNKIGVQLSGSVGNAVAGEKGDAYFVRWAGRRRFLEQHIGKGGGREDRYCLRIYFFWDEITKRCIVGSLPQHLDNSLS